MSIPQQPCAVVRQVQPVGGANSATGRVVSMTSVLHMLSAASSSELAVAANVLVGANGGSARPLAYAGTKAASAAIRTVMPVGGGKEPRNWQMGPHGMFVKRRVEKRVRSPATAPPSGRTTGTAHQPRPIIGDRFAVQPVGGAKQPRFTLQEVLARTGVALGGS